MQLTRLAMVAQAVDGLGDKFNNDRMICIRKRAAALLLANLDNLDEMESSHDVHDLLDFFEGVGNMTMRRIIDADMVWHNFAFWAICY